MNTVVEHHFIDAASNRHLDWLESEAIHIMREVAAECSNPALLFSGGKDSIVLLRLAEKAFRPGKFPFPLVHIDTGHNFPEVIAFRDKRVAELGERLIVGSVEESIKRGTVRLRNPATDSRNAGRQ
jgi:sulfate adenylyltransferase subunit 2